MAGFEWTKVRKKVQRRNGSTVQRQEQLLDRNQLIEKLFCVAFAIEPLCRCAINLYH